MDNPPPKPPLVAIWDTETNGLLMPQAGKTVATRMHGVGFKIGAQWFSCADQPEYDGRVVDIRLPSGLVLTGVTQCSIADGLRVLETADIRVAHNGQDFDERVTRKLYPWWNPKGRCLDTLLLSRLLYPDIYKFGPNTHKCPGQLKTRHSIEAWGYRLGEKKDKGFDPGDWQTWSPDMQLYMLQDVVSLERLYRWLMSQKPSMAAVDIEHGFAAIMRRQEAWGFTFDYEKALALQAKLATTMAALEADLVDTFGKFWIRGKLTTVKATRNVKMTAFADVTRPRTGATGKPLKPYVGPPLCQYEEGAVYTEIERVEFQPSSRDHVRLMLGQKYGWVPKKFTDKGTPQVDDEVLRALPYPEAPKLADYYAALKTAGYVSTGKNAWLALAHEEADGQYRMHGRVNTIGTYTFRASHMSPNMGQIPTRDPTYGHLCRELFTQRKKFRLGGFDGSGMQLRLLAHYLFTWDHGAYAKVVSEGDPHAYIRDLVGTDIMGEADEGRGKGKTLNYTIVFGGGDGAVGRVVKPYGSDHEKARIGAEIKERASDLFGPLNSLKAALKERIQERGTLVGLDGRIARGAKPHTGLSTLLQMGEGVVMKKALIIHDEYLQAHGLRPGVDGAGLCHPEDADYEFCANVHDEAQADIRQAALAVYERSALQCVTQAGLELGVKCPLKSDFKAGPNWSSTH